MQPSIRQFMRALCVAVVAAQLAWADAAHARDATPTPLPPSQVYGELFAQVQTQRLFPDSKTFADAIAKSTPEKILQAYESRRREPGFSLAAFVRENFTIPDAVGTNFTTGPNEDVRVHIERLWPALTREPAPASGADSHLPLDTRYVVPGGRFREMYYWDSYFTMLGLQQGGRDDLVAAMVQNFAGLIDRYGHIPNGSRSYYLSRSQPPFFAAMVELQAAREGDSALLRRLPQLEREYSFWMDGVERLAPGTAHRRVVRLADGRVLNRYWDDLATPRDEAYLEDIETARKATRPAAEVYRNLRAAAESGWDFSSRWLADGKTLSTIRTTEILPVDLNSLLYKLEVIIARGCKIAARSDCNRQMLGRAKARQRTMMQLMWDGGRNAFFDYDWRNGRRLTRLTAATAYPLFADLVDADRAHRVAGTIRKSLLMPHGLATTLEDTGQQWDEPNGWAPLQWVAVDGLRRHGEAALAENIATAWVTENARVYCQTGKLVEKYNVRDAGAGAGGEYPVQDGFGWTNAVLIRFLAIYPKLSQSNLKFTGADCAAQPMP